MAKDYPLHIGDELPEFWVEQIQEYIGALTPYLRLTRLSDTSLRLTAASTDQHAAGIGGLWRYITGNADATHPGGSAGSYDVILVASDNDIVNTPDPFTDNTDYAFYLEIVVAGAVPVGNTPAGHPIVAWRKIGECEWDGAKLVGLRQLVGASDTTLPVQPQSLGPGFWAIKVLAHASQDPTVPFATFQDGVGAHVLDVFTGGISVRGSLSVSGSTEFAASPVMPTPTVGDDSTKGATTAFVRRAVSNVLPITLNSIDPAVWANVHAVGRYDDIPVPSIARLDYFYIAVGSTNPNNDGLYVCILAGSAYVWKKIQLAVSLAPAARAYMNAEVQVTNTNAAIKVPIDTVDFDPGNSWDLANHRYVVPQSGRYHVVANIGNDWYRGGYNWWLYGMQVRVNNVLRLGSDTNNWGGKWGQAGDVLSDYIQVNAGDFIELWWWPPYWYFAYPLRASMTLAQAG